MDSAQLCQHLKAASETRRVVAAHEEDGRVLGSQARKDALPSCQFRNGAAGCAENARGSEATPKEQDKLTVAIGEDSLHVDVVETTQKFQRASEDGAVPQRPMVSREVKGLDETRGHW